MKNARSEECSLLLTKLRLAAVVRDVSLKSSKLRQELIMITDLWAFERDQIVPDIVLLSKTLGAGLPLGAVVTTSAIAEAARRAGFLWVRTGPPTPTSLLHVFIAQLLKRAHRIVDYASERFGCCSRWNQGKLPAAFRVMLQILVLTSWSGSRNSDT